MTSRSFRTLQQCIIDCRKCPRLVEWRERVADEKVLRFRNETYWGRPIPAFGEPTAQLAIIGLAPAAHGGNRTGRMFTGDSSGDWLFEALHRFGFASKSNSLRRDDGQSLHHCIITAAVRCAPPANQPLPDELNSCRAFLREELKMLSSLRVVITLGHIAFRAFLQAWRDNTGASPAPAVSFRHSGEYALEDGITLITSYHPSRQNTQTGRLTRSMFYGIFERARSLISGDP